MQFGDLELTIISGRRFRLDGGAMFGVVPKVLWERKFPADARNRIALATNCLLVRGDAFAVLIGTGPGDRWSAREQDTHAVENSPGLLESLEEAGVRPEEIDAIVLSHLQSQHAGGATGLSGSGLVANFPNATLYVQAAELAYARAPNKSDRASYRSDDWEPYTRAGRIEEIHGEREIRPGVRALPLPEHNAGMQAVRIDSAGQTAFYFADALPTIAHVPLPWIMAHDRYPAELIANKKRLLDEAVRERWLCVFEHDPNVAWGRIVDEPNGKRRVHVVSLTQAQAEPQDVLV